MTELVSRFLLPIHVHDKRQATIGAAVDDRGHVLLITGVDDDGDPIVVARLNGLPLRLTLQQALDYQLALRDAIAEASLRAR